ncbi:response regulator [Paucibacter sediminis]|uniref:Response regulator n=1 Tax=Paucibacter sediminis TaxID=3019553 RepID=A0AA95NDI8_9BURK|nr:tetratricopeptide repeat-containing response regulator [Paucibacter sp. S2-9]WIT11728.1 response regulator [Paucibacter sp. S2-9]
MRADTPYSRIEALVVDDMATQQTTLRGQLGMLGIHKIEGASSAEEALRHVRAKPFGLILCDYNLNHKTDGQQLLEYLREHQLLAPDCLFFMITAENSYLSVAAASEHLPDAYLLKPITAGDIEDRLKAQLEKRQALLDIHKQLGRKDLPAALKACDTLLAKKDRWTMQALQLKGQVLLELGALDEARAVYQQALELRPQLIWAQLGQARALRAAGRFDETVQLMRELIGSAEGAKNLAAHELLAQALEAMNRQDEALAVLKQAAEIVPSAKRMRTLAESAYRNGDTELAKQSLARALKSSQGSLSAQPMDALVLAQAHIDLGEAKEALAVLVDPPGKVQRSAEQAAAMLALSAQAHALLGEAEKARELAEQALAETPQAKADFATIAVARAALATGQAERGLALLGKVVSADHENARMQQLVSKALRDTGHEAEIANIVTATSGGLKTRLHQAKLALRAGRLDEALAALEAELHAFPENTTVLMECAQMNCMVLRLRKQLDAQRVEQVRGYLSRLERLLPGHDRVAQMRKYLRDTLSALA